MHLVVVEVVDRDRTEGVEPDDQLDRFDARSCGAAGTEHVVGQVQAGGRRRGGRGPPREHRLVSLGIGQRLGDVGRQRHLPPRG